MKPWTGIALMPETEFIASALPLFQEEAIEVLEWSFDTLHAGQRELEWLPLLLSDFAKKGRLIGHGVRYSLLNGNWTKNQHTWLKQLELEVAKYHYRHVTEHFGFMTSDHFHHGAPLPVPLTSTTLAIGQDRLKRLLQYASVPVGIENLAFAFSLEQIKAQGEFLEKLVEPVNGFLILDLHNIWCQAVNFDIDPQYLIDSYPLDKVREIHISGGSWSSVSSSEKAIRRDTHDEAVPEDLFDLLKYALPKCKYTEAVIFERMGNSVNDVPQQEQFRADFRKLKQTVADISGNEQGPLELIKKAEYTMAELGDPLESKELSRQQALLITLLSTDSAIEQVITSIRANKELQDSGWNTSSWTVEMIETATQLLRKWN